MDIDLDTATTLAWVRGIASAINQQADHLTQLDAAIGDADHGVNMRRGFTAVEAALDSAEFGAVGAVLLKTGTLVSGVGGASGPLYGSAFRAAGEQLPEPTATPWQLLDALRAGMEAVQKLGAAQPGDKTMIDAYSPALGAFDKALHSGLDLAVATCTAADAAEAGMRDTIPMTARKGRASYLGLRSQGHQDPGATSAALVFRALAEALSR